METNTLILTPPSSGLQNIHLSRQEIWTKAKIDVNAKATKTPMKESYCCGEPTEHVHGDKLSCRTQAKPAPPSIVVNKTQTRDTALSLSLFLAWPASAVDMTPRQTR
jgi:hypothetical protein